MTLRTLFAAAALATTVAAPVSAALVDVTIDFKDYKFTFFGIDDALTTMQTATAIYVRAVVATWTVDLRGVPPGAYSAEAIFNADGSFESRIDLSLIGPVSSERRGYVDTLDQIDVQCLYSPLEFGCDGQLLYSTSSPTYFFSEHVVFSSRQNSPEEFRISPSTTAPTSPVPLPAGGLLLLSAVGGAAALKRRKTRAAA